MAFHVRDPRTDRVVRALAARKGVTLSEAILLACEGELERLGEDRIRARMEPIWERLRRYPRTGLNADKAFFDELSGDG